MTEEKQEENLLTKKVSRRAVIAGIASGAVVGAVAGIASGSMLAPKGETGSAGIQGPAGPLINSPGAVYPIKYTMDVVVIGAGGGGMCAAVSAAQEGLKTLVLEISQKTGGGQVYSGGQLHTAGLQDWDQYLAYTEGLHDPNLGQTYVTTFRNTLLPWLTSIGAYFSMGTGKGPLWEGDPFLGHGEPQGKRLYFTSLETALTKAGGQILLKTRGLKLLTDTNGKLAGVRASTWSASPTEQNQTIFDISTKSVILANGNFINNPELKMKYIAPYADRALVEGVPYARGDGMLMAQELGASLSGSMDSFSGTTCALTPVDNQTESDPDKFEQASAASNPDGSDYGTKVTAGMYGHPLWIAYCGPGFPAPPGAPSDPAWTYGTDVVIGPSYAILVNLQGKRFVDENSPMDAKYARLPQAVLQQRQGTALLIADKVIHDKDKYADASMQALTAPGVGGTVVTANSLQDLATGIAAKFPFYPSTFLQEISDYNAAIDAATTSQLSTPRTVLPTSVEPNGGLYKISTPPFYAVALTACMYYNMGGLAINTSAEVLDMEKTPIPGLYATFPCAGGLMKGMYTGGNASSSTFGYIAGKSAATYIKSLPT